MKSFFIHWTFNFVYFYGKTIYKFKISTKCWFNLIVVCLIWKYTNSSVREHVHYHQTMRFRAHDIKWFHSNDSITNLFVYILYPWCVCVTGSCTVRWENKTMYCIVSVFGLAIWASTPPPPPPSHAGHTTPCWQPVTTTSQQKPFWYHTVCSL